VRPVSGVKAQELIYDLGPETIKYYKEIIKQAKLIIWNGPLGRFEQPGFEKGSCEIALAIAASQAKQVVGGGETLQVVNDLGIAPYLYHVSTGGGAMLEYLEGEKFPVIKKLNKN
jgi:phosphoglycerate kinase